MMDKFFEKEQPEFITIKGGELRLYNEQRRLAVSKPSWSNDEGVHMGKTVTIDLTANKGNQELIGLLQKTIDILQAVNSTQKE